MDFCESANWASEASPTLGCPIEISCDIYIYMCVLKRMLKVSFGRLNLNCDTCVIHFDYTPEQR